MTEAVLESHNEGKALSRLQKVFCGTRKPTRGMTSRSLKLAG